MLADLANFIRDNTPNYNGYLLRGYMAEQVAGAADFVGTMFGEAVKLFDGHIQYRGYAIMPPERRADYEMKPSKSGGVGGCRVTTSDMILVEYVFSYQDREYRTPLYIPYLYNDAIRVEDTVYVLPHAIKEQAFSRIASGVTLKVIRQPLPFHQNTTYRLNSLSDDWVSNEMVPTTVIHNLSERNGRGKLPAATIIHYLLCKFGFVATLARFDIAPDECAFAMEIGADTETFRYFNARQVKKKAPAELFLKVSKAKLEHPVVCKFIASLLHVLTSFSRHSVEDLYEPTGIIFRVLLAKIIYGHSLNEIQGERRLGSHIASLDTYLDPITQRRLCDYGIVVKDIYDLLQYVFCEIDRLARVSHTDLYGTRIDYLEELLGETVIRAIYSRWYPLVRRLGGRLNDAEVTKILRFPDNLIGRLSSSRIVQKSPSQYGDNVLVGRLSQKVRLSGLSSSGTIIGSPDHRFHPSMAVVESITAFSKTNPGAAGTINPYLEITSNGSVVRPPYADEIDELTSYLPY